MSRGVSVTKMSYIVTECQTMFYNAKLGPEMVCCTCDRGQFHNITQSLKKSVLTRFNGIE